MIAALLLAGQLLATPATPLPSARTRSTPPQRIILTNCPVGTGDDIVVCGTPDSPRLPLPDDRGPPDHPVPSNPDMTSIGALAAEATPCAATQWGCKSSVNVGAMATALVRLVGKVIDPDSCCDQPGDATDPGKLIADTVGGVRKIFARKPDKSGRVPIDLDAPPPPTAGRLTR
jgi:hypothetical protein